MKSIRLGMWETNSSSLHQLAICTDPPSEIESYRNQTITVSAPWAVSSLGVGDLDLSFDTLSDRIAALIASWNEEGTIYDPIETREMNGEEPNDWDDDVRMKPVAEYLKRVANITLEIDWPSFDGVRVCHLPVGGFVRYYCSNDDTMGAYLFNDHYFAVIDDPADKGDDAEDDEDDVHRRLPVSKNYRVYEIPVH